MKTRRISLNAYFSLAFVPGDDFLAILKTRILGCIRRGKFLAFCSTKVQMADANSG